ncbi:MAG: hypothetical protein ACOY37_08045 [Pseudomonadota bacterium]
MSFDKNNILVYKLLAWAIGLACVVVTISLVVNRTDPLDPKQAASVALLLLAAVWASRVAKSRQPSSTLAVTSILFAAGCWFTVFSTKAAAIIAGASFLVLLVNFSMGDKADVDTPKKKIKIRLPW